MASLAYVTFVAMASQKVLGLVEESDHVSG